MKKCKVENCYNKQQYLIKGYCTKHYTQIKRYGKIFSRTRFDKNKIIDCGNYYKICLYNKEVAGKEIKEIARTKIDKEDLDKVIKYKWCKTKNGYVMNSNFQLMHVLILGRIKGMDIDHINHNKLDNRKNNLRHCTRSQNGMNKKNIKGYCFNKGIKKWVVEIKKGGNRYYIGKFENKNDAIIARKKAEKKYFGEYAYKL